MSWSSTGTWRLRRQAPSLPPGPHRWAVVDVETSGLDERSHRVLSVAALALDSKGRTERTVVSLVDPGVDPGPVHVHGLTLKALAGAPTFAEVLPQLREILEGRVLVAHNAAFDHRFLAAEATRAGSTLPTRQRLCTLALSRRLGVPVSNHRLATLAAHWRVDQGQTHEAHEDARVLSAVFAHSLDLAVRLDMPLPVVDCDGRSGRVPYPTRVPRTACPWTCPQPYRPGGQLVQGMKVVLTGPTRIPREELVARLTAAGLDVLDSVSRLTSLLVCNAPWIDTIKAARARTEGTPVLDEETLLQLLRDVRPGGLKADRVTVPEQRGPVLRRAPFTAPGPMARRRVLVLGGTHLQAATVRAEVVARGGVAAVNLSANVTDLVLLDRAEYDPRVARALAAGVHVHESAAAFGVAVGEQVPRVDLPGPVDAVQLPDEDERPEPADPDPAVLARGEVVDLPPGAIWTVNTAWRASAMTSGTELDVVAFLLDGDGRVVTDEDFVFYNAPVSQDGAVALSVDGNSEQSIRIDLRRLPEHCERVVVAGALLGGGTFGDLGAVTISVDSEHATAATATLDAGTTEVTMLLAEVYRRHGCWRVRAVGQGHDDGLAELVGRFGVQVE